jgi:putative transposase
MVWVPKYRDRVLSDEVGKEVHSCPRLFRGQLSCDVIRLNVQSDHVHLLSMVPPKVSISESVGLLKGCRAMRAFKQSPYLNGSSIGAIIFGHWVTVRIR